MAEQFGDADTINDAKSHLSDAASIIKEAAEKGQDWRQALQDSGKWSALKEAAKSGAIADLGQIAGRLLKSWSSGSLKEQQDRLNELIELADRSDEHTSELQSLMRISYAGVCWTKKHEIRITTLCKH